MLEALPIQTSSECPSSEAVQAEVRELSTPEQRRQVAPDARVVISDRGDSIAIELTHDGKTAVRVYRDEARDCERRAHFASVLVVVTLMPPELGSSEPAPDPAPQPEPTPPPLPPPSLPSPEPPPTPEPPATKRSVRIEVGGRGEVGTPISDSVRVALLGGDLGVALGPGALRLLLGVGYAPRSQLRYTGRTAGSAELQRVDFALGARFTFVDALLKVGLDASVVVTRAEVSGLSAKRPASDTTLGAGGRLGLHATWGEPGPLSPFVGVFVAGFPRAAALSHLPQGTVGHLPYVWLGARAGLCLAL